MRHAYFKGIDIASDERFTYAMRVELGQVFQRSDSDFTKMWEAFKVVYGYSPKWLPRIARWKRMEAIAEGLKSWIDKEQTMLHYDPTAEEQQAGIDKLGEKVGSMSTVQALARSFGKDPDVVLAWPYVKVFGILYVDLENNKYNTKLQKVINGKYQRHTTRRR